MSSDGSVTRLIVMLKGGNRAASQQLWEAYFGRLVGLARARLRGIPGRMADEEDVALSAFESFYRRAEQGQFPQLEDRDDLWQLLLVPSLGATHTLNSTPNSWGDKRLESVVVIPTRG